MIKRPIEEIEETDPAPDAFIAYFKTRAQCGGTCRRHPSGWLVYDRDYGRLCGKCSLETRHTPLALAVALLRLPQIMAETNWDDFVAKLMLARLPI